MAEIKYLRKITILFYSLEPLKTFTTNIYILIASFTDVNESRNMSIKPQNALTPVRLWTVIRAANVVKKNALTQPNTFYFYFIANHKKRIRIISNSLEIKIIVK